MVVGRIRQYKARQVSLTTCKWNYSENEMNFKYASSILNTLCNPYMHRISMLPNALSYKLWLAHGADMYIQGVCNGDITMNHVQQCSNM